MIKEKFFIPEAKLNNWEITHFEISEEDADFYNLRQAISGQGRNVVAGKFMKLVRNERTTVMSDTPTELIEFSYFAHTAIGRILINGLGLGLVVNALLKKGSVESITVIEKEADVISLVSPHFNDERLTIIHADAFLYQPAQGKKYDYVWHDIWDGICSDNLKEMTKLKRKYGRRTVEYQGCWCEYECRRLRY